GNAGPQGRKCMSWTIPAVSLSAVTLTTTEQDGTVIDLDEVLSDHGVQWVLAHAASDTWVLLLEGSLDGSDWYAMGSYQQGGSGTGTAATEVVLTTASFSP